MISGALLFSSILAAAVGLGLLMRASWARVAGMVMGVLALTAVPFGTVLGIYTLWVLARVEGRGLNSAAAR
jgi:hypothetical protein